jgi:FkbM family methyltransferase
MALAGSRLRTKVLTVLGGSSPVMMWAGSKAGPFGVKVRRPAGGVELRKADRAILLAPKHAFYAPEVAEAFDAYAYALPATVQDGVSTVDFAAAPDAFNICRRALRAGVTIEAKDGVIWLHKGRQAMILAAHHFVYAADNAETFERLFSPLVPELRDGVEVLDYSAPGKLQTYRGSGLQFEMASFPEEEDELEESFHWYRPKAGDLVFEIGAHCGVSTYHFAKMVGPTGKVVAFEPDPVNFAILQRNMERHGLTNVVLQNAAVAGEAGKLAFSSEGTVGSMLMSVLGRPPAGPVVTVDAMTLEDAFERWGVPAFCKVDIEGSEIEVVAKSAELLKKHKTNFALDTCHLKSDGQSTHTDVEALFRSYGYEVASEAKPLMATWARAPLA